MAKSRPATVTVFDIAEDGGPYPAKGYQRYYGDISLALEGAQREVDISRWIVVEDGEYCFMSVRDSEFKDVTKHHNTTGAYWYPTYAQWDKLFPRENPTDAPRADMFVYVIGDPQAQDHFRHGPEAPPAKYSLVDFQTFDDVSLALAAAERERGLDRWVGVWEHYRYPGRDQMSCFLSVADSEFKDITDSVRNGSWEYVFDNFEVLFPLENPELNENPDAEDMVSEFLSRTVHYEYLPGLDFRSEADARWNAERAVMRADVLRDFPLEDIQSFIEYCKDAVMAVPEGVGAKVTSMWVRGNFYLAHFGDSVYIQFRDRGPRRANLGNAPATICVRADQSDDFLASADWRRNTETFGGQSEDFPTFTYYRTPPWELRTNPDDSAELGPNELFDELVAQVGFARPPKLLVDEKRALAGRKPGTARAFAATTGDGETVYVSPRLYDQSYDRYAAILMHELAHAWLLSYKEDHTEREADTKAEELFGHKIRYDKEDVQTLGPGTSPRPKRLK